jgi:FeS assembly SUF system protein|tara:strand:+ start:6140 stop:6466 length:327 start_codon:yes stop_codon:yes gene_type:complete
VDISEKDSKNVINGSIIEALGTVYDPEIPVSIWELGLVYNIDIDDKFNVVITMTLTTPNCPEAETIPDRVAEAVSKCKDVGDVRVEIVWEPTWTQDNMSEAARLELGF